MATTPTTSRPTSATASLSGYRQSPRKVRLVANLVKGRTVEQALLELSFLDKRAAPIFAKLIRSVAANAKAAGLDEKMLIVKELRVDKAPVLKRSMPRAHGRAFPIHKHTSHILVTLGEAPAKKVRGATTKADATTTNTAKKVASAAKKKPAASAKK